MAWISLAGDIKSPASSTLQVTETRKLSHHGKVVVHTHPLNDLNAYSDPPRNLKATIFHKNEYTNIIISEPDITPEESRENLKHIHTTSTSQYLNFRENNKVIYNTPHNIHSPEQTLLHHMRTKLAQLKANKSPLLQSYLHTVNPDTYMPQYPLWLSPTHDTNHLFNCSQVPTQHNITSLWKKPLEAAEVIPKWKSRLASLKD